MRNTAHTRIHWKFGRKDARRKFRYNRNTLKRWENQQGDEKVTAGAARWFHGLQAVKQLLKTQPEACAPIVHSISGSVLRGLFHHPVSLIMDPFCNAEARAAWSFRDRSRIALTLRMVDNSTGLVTDSSDDRRFPSLRSCGPASPIIRIGWRESIAKYRDG
jgi:hypothetical protein